MDVGAWLRGLGLEQYEAAFRNNAIDDSILPHLTADDLKDLGIVIVGHRRKLLDAAGGGKASRGLGVIGAQGGGAVRRAFRLAR